MQKFKLQTVLDHRQRLEDRARQGLSSAIQYEHQIMSSLTDETAALAEICREYETRQQQGMHGHEFMLYENRISHKRQILKELDVQLGEARQRVVQAREELGEMSREKKLLEKLKEKKLAEIKQELHRQEMIQIDEVAIMFKKGDK